MGWKTKKVDIKNETSVKDLFEGKLKDFPGLKPPSDTESVRTIALENKISSLDTAIQEVILQGRQELKELREEIKSLRQVYIKKPPSPLREYEDSSKYPKTYEELKEFPLRHKNYHERYFAAESSTNFTIRLELWAFLSLMTDLSESGKGKLDKDLIWYYNYAISNIRDRILDFSEEADKEKKPLALWVNENITY